MKLYHLVLLLAMASVHVSASNFFAMCCGRVKDPKEMVKENGDDCVPCDDDIVIGRPPKAKPHEIPGGRRRTDGGIEARALAAPPVDINPITLITAGAGRPVLLPKMPLDHRGNHVIATQIESAWARALELNVSPDRTIGPLNIDGALARYSGEKIIRYVLTRFYMNDRRLNRQGSMSCSEFGPSRARDVVKMIRSWKGEGYKTLTHEVVGMFKRAGDSMIIESGSINPRRWVIAADTGRIETLEGRYRRSRELVLFDERGRRSASAGERAARDQLRSNVNKHGGIVAKEHILPEFRHHFEDDVAHGGKAMSRRVRVGEMADAFGRVGIPFIAGASGTIQHLILAMEEIIVPDESTGLTRAKLAQMVSAGKTPAQILAAGFQQTIPDARTREHIIVMWTATMVNFAHHSALECIITAQAMGYFQDLPFPFTMTRGRHGAIQVSKNVNRALVTRQAPATMFGPVYTTCLYAFMDRAAEMGWVLGG